MPQGEQVAVVTGISSGMGFETSLMLERNGFHTYATMRKLNGGGGSKQIADIAKNYEMIQGAQIANSFILLMVLSNATEPTTGVLHCFYTVVIIIGKLKIREEACI